MSKILKFPDGFLWGTSTAAAQIETASEHNWKGVQSKDGYTFLRTSDHEKRRTEDIGYIKQFGSVYRCGVDWARLQSEPFAPFNADVIKEYQDFFQNLLDDDMQIMFVLHHFTHPLWYEDKGAFEDEANIPAFINYVEQCITHFGPYAFMWNTFNEPGVYTMNGYLLGNFPPFKKKFFLGNKVVKNMGKAHNIAYDLLKADDPDKQVGISKNNIWVEALNIFGKPLAKFVDWWFIDFVAAQFEKVDFWGLSYYAYIPFNPLPVTEIDNPGKLDEMGIPRDTMWGYYPEGFKKIIQRFYKKYNKPILITESGVCTDDPEYRIQALKDYLGHIHDLIEDGIPVLGYTFWSTMDNFEWNLGPTFRFGLVRVDFETMDRTMTSAGEFYAKITADNAVDLDYMSSKDA